VVGPLDPENEARTYLGDAARNASELAAGDLPTLAAKAGSILAKTLRGGSKVLFCGNGGSAADAQHLATELVGLPDAGRDREPLRGLALTTDTSALTAVANDLGFEEVFSRQVRALAVPGDTLVCLSTGGRSPNVLRAAEAALRGGLRVVALVGPADSPLDGLADVCLHVPGDSSGHVQEGHITLGHLLCRLAEIG
jgi:D-sedoheptulose 7-phosphate isomerase